MKRSQGHILSKENFSSHLRIICIFLKVIVNVLIKGYFVKNIIVLYKKNGGGEADGRYE